MKQKTSCIAVIALFVSVFASSCSNSGTGITKLEVGEKDAAEAVTGAPLAVKADIALDAKITSVDVQIVSASAGAGSFSEDFTEKYAGSAKASFRENINIPENAGIGNYDLILKVVDENGTIEEGRRTIRIALDSTVPVVSDLDVGINASGDDLHLEAHITAAKKIRQVTVTVKGADWARDFVYDQARIRDQMSVHFHEHAHVDEAPAGEYEVIVMVEDQDGRTAVAVGGFEKK